MGEVRGFLEHPRREGEKEMPHLRTQHSREFVEALDAGEARRQAARCMDCGVPFCHKACPLGNVIPGFNDALSREDWRSALELLLKTNPFPEFTGRICPAPCESACVLGINNDPVAIETIEKSLAEKGFAEGWITPRPPRRQTGQRVAVVGSGPAGLAAAWLLNQSGHSVTVFERQEEAGGLLMFGIPDFKLAKDKVRRRIELLAAEGIVFRTGVDIGRDLPIAKVEAEFDAVVLAAGATKPRDLLIPGRDLAGIHFAFDFLKGQTLAIEGGTEPLISARGKRVVVIGGGDTGSDCVGISHRQGAASVVQFEVLNEPPHVGPFPRRWERPASTPWPEWPLILRVSTSHEEGGERYWSTITEAFLPDASSKQVASLRTRVNEPQGALGQQGATATRDWPCDLVLIAVGYTGTEWPEKLVAASEGSTLQSVYGTDRPSVFQGGDMRRGQSLVVWAIREGLDAARAADGFLKAQAPAIKSKNCH